MHIRLDDTYAVWKHALRILTRTSYYTDAGVPLPLLVSLPHAQSTSHTLGRITIVILTPVGKLQLHFLFCQA